MYAQVVLPLSSYQSFTYQVPEHLQAVISAGRFVSVPFRRRSVTGVVISLHPVASFKGKIKAVAALHPYTFRAVTKKTKKQGGGWAIETFGPWEQWADRIEAVEKTLRCPEADP